MADHLGLHFRTCRWLLSVLLLSSCALQPDKEALTQRPGRDSISAFLLTGRVSIRNAETAQHASLVWQHGSGADRIELSGPLGQRVAVLSRDVSGARLETSAHEVVTAAGWSGLAERVLGAALPLDNMPRWMLGQTDDKGRIIRDELGRPLEAEMADWHVKYLRYESEQASALPILIELQHDEINVRLKIDQWQIN